MLQVFRDYLVAGLQWSKAAASRRTQKKESSPRLGGR
jgi:hypothetical protein